MGFRVPDFCGERCGYTVMFYTIFKGCFHITWEIMSNATAQWWFSSGEMSLYLMASSVLAFTCRRKPNKQINIGICLHLPKKLKND